MKKTLLKIVAAVLSAITLTAVCACGTDKTLAYKELPSTGEQYGYCVSPSDTELLKSVNSILAEIKADGTIDKLYAAEDNHTAGNIGEVKTQSTDRSSELVVATNAEFAPFEYKDGNYFAGIDMQIAKIIANKLGKTLVVSDMDFDTVIVSVSQGRCDIGMAGLTISDDRSENVTFSDAYYESTQAVAYFASNDTFASCKSATDVENAIKNISSAKAGAATGQTGYYYLTGSADFGFAGFKNISVNQYDTIALAVKDLQNGKIDFVVGDRDTVKAVVSAMNG